jgi:ornithine carbamoyltransferase
VALLFNDTSLRNRTAIQIGVNQLGGQCIDLQYSEADRKAGENIKDILKVITLYGVGAIITRGIPQNELDAFMEVSTIPIINSTNDDFVPMQTICDLFTIWEKLGHLEGLNLAYVGKGSPVAASLIMGATKCGMHVAVATPAEFPIKPQHVESARQYGNILVTENPVEAVKNADIIYTDTYWYHREPSEEEKAILKTYRITPGLMSFAKPNTLFMHPLPAKRGVEVSTEIIDGKNSIVYTQAENKLHTVKAILAMLIR